MAEISEGWYAHLDKVTVIAELNQCPAWEPRLQLDGHSLSTCIWFATEAECLQFIVTEILGQSLLAQPEET